MSRSAIILSFSELASVVDNWRLDTVEVARLGVPPHITLLFPWKKTPITEVDINAVADICSQSAAFDVTFDNVSYFDSGCIYLSLFNEKDVVKLSSKLWAKFPNTPPYEGLHKNPIPHLTVAQSDTESIEIMHSNILQALQSIFPHTCTVGQVVILEENDFCKWCVKAELALG